MGILFFVLTHRVKMSYYMFKKLSVISYHLSTIFIVSLVVRLIYCFAMPIFKVRLDEQRYDILSDQIINGNYNLDAISFICAPFVPFFLALIKCISVSYCREIFFICQCVLSALSVVYVFKLTDLLFRNKQISTIAAWFFCFYPMGFYYVKNIGQETAYQSFLIMSVYFLVRFGELKNKRDLIISAILFSLCFLTKGIILFWSPFIVYFIFEIKAFNRQQKFVNALIFSSLCLLFTLPFGFYNLQKHGVYTFSSDGIGHYLWFGNSELAYQQEYMGRTYGVNTAGNVRDTAKLIYDMSPPNVSMETYQNAFVSYPSERERQAIFKRNALNWIKNNPERFVELKINGVIRFILPGVNYKIYPLSIWLFSLIIFVPFYFLAYWGIFQSFKIDFEKHNWILTLILAMFLFSTLFAFGTRFKTATLEPFYIIYAAFSAYHLGIKFSHRFSQRLR